jgi:hypothetical protein
MSSSEDTKVGLIVPLCAVPRNHVTAHSSIGQSGQGPRSWGRGLGTLDPDAVRFSLHTTSGSKVRTRPEDTSGQRRRAFRTCRLDSSPRR